MKWFWKSLEPAGTFIIAMLAGAWYLLFPILIFIGVLYAFYGIALLFNL